MTNQIWLTLGYVFVAIVTMATMQFFRPGGEDYVLYEKDGITWLLAALLSLLWPIVLCFVLFSVPGYYAPNLLRERMKERRLKKQEENEKIVEERHSVLYNHRAALRSPKITELMLRPLRFLICRATIWSVNTFNFLSMVRSSQR